MNWTHNMCQKCWDKKYPDREALTMKNAELTLCCFCGESNRDGIYVRHNPTELKCQHEQ